jgi:hypothetical protein
MSYRSGHHSEYPQHPHDHGRTSGRRPAAGHAVAVTAAPAAEAGYTLVHAGKQVRFGPVVFWIVIGTVTVLGMWSAATATYFAFRDDVLTRLIARQAEMQYAYEDRIAELRAKVDRTTSRQMLDQEQFDKKLDQIMRRQTALEARATALGAMPDTQVTGSIRPPSRGAATNDAASQATPKPSPISDTVIFVAPPDREARLESRAPLNVAAQPNQFAKVQGVDNVLVRLQSSLDQVENRQMAALNSVEDGMESRVRRMRGVFSDLGLDMGQLEAATPRAGMGGPFVPVKLSADSGPFERQLYRINITRAQVDRLNRVLALVPYRKPVIGEVEFTSVSVYAATRSWAARRCTRASISAPRWAIPSAPPRTAKSPPPDGPAATAAWWKSTTATGCRPATAIYRRSASRSATPSRSDRSSAPSARPAGRPVRICIMKPGSTAKRSTRRNSCAPGCG